MADHSPQATTPTRRPSGRLFGRLLNHWPALTRDTWRADLLAGLAGAIVALPQCIAFAALAGLPLEYGLYCAMLPTLVAALAGSSWHSMSGPSNAISMMVFATLAPLAAPGSPEYVAMALTLAFLCGVMMLVLGFARLGVLVNFVSHTVVVSFSTGVGVLIFASQLAPALGMQVERASAFLPMLQQVGAHLGGINPQAVAVALATVIAGFATMRLAPRIPYMITAMAAGGVLAWLLERLQPGATGIQLLGTVPSGLPPLSHPSFSLDTLQSLTGIAVAITALSLTQTMASCRGVALRSGQRLDANREFIGQGLANIAASFTSGFPNSGSFNRTSANVDAGARTPVAAASSALFLIVVLFTVAPLLALIPKPAMAGVLLLVAWRLVEVREIRRIVAAGRAEYAVFGVTLAATLLMNLETAVMFGVLLSLAVYLHTTASPRFAAIVPNPDSPTRKAMYVATGIPECPQFRMVRVEGGLYFGAADHAEQELEAIRAAHPLQKHLALMSKSINYVDLTGAKVLAEEAARRRREGGGLVLHGVRPQIVQALDAAGALAVIGRGNLFDTKQAAIGHVFAHLDRGICATCRARIFEECRTLPPPVDAAPAKLPD